METQKLSNGNSNYINIIMQQRQKPKEQKIPSKTIKEVSVAVAIGVSAVVIGGLLFKNKISPNILKLSETIDFKEATTLKEAIEYGTKKLGIKKYKGFEEKDLDVLNWINEGLTLCANKAKDKGQIVMPKKISYYTEQYFNNEGWQELAYIGPFGSLNISKNTISDFKNAAVKIINSYEGSQEAKNKLIETLNFKKAYRIFIAAANKTNKNTLSWNKGIFSTITHEMGHLQHKFNVRDFHFFQSLGTEQERPKKLAKGAEELLKLFDSKKDVAAKVSTYAKESPCEFVAEVYSQLAHGLTLDDDVMDLYQKLFGV